MVQGIGGDDGGVSVVAEGWQNGQHRDQEEDGVSGFYSDSSKHDVEAEAALLGAEEEGEEDAANASDDGGSERDPGQSATKTTATERSDGDEAATSKSHIKDPSVMRLSRRIARSGIASRREAERLIEGGFVTVNGVVVQTPALNVGPRDMVKVKVRCDMYVRLFVCFVVCFMPLKLFFFSSFFVNFVPLYRCAYVQCEFQ